MERHSEGSARRISCAYQRCLY